jgi:hypothetical protein
MNASPSIVTVCISAVLWLAGDAVAGKHLALPNYMGQPGKVVPVPLTLSDATLLASAKITVNYDASLLTFVQGRNEGLGSAFELMASAEDGVATLVFTRSTSLTSGSGHLAVIEFRVNATAEAGLASPLVIAAHELGDETGVRKLELVEAVTVQSGSLEVTTNRVDNDDDHIPDDWEMANGLSVVASNAGKDSDGDGISDFAEFGFGLNPLSADASTGSHVGRMMHTDGADYLSIEFRRRKDAGSSLSYVIEESSGLVTWTPVNIESNFTGAAVDLGNGMEAVTFRGNIPLTGPAAQPRGFLRARVSGQ